MMTSISFHFGSRMRIIRFTKCRVGKMKSRVGKLKKFRHFARNTLPTLA